MKHVWRYLIWIHIIYLKEVFGIVQNMSLKIEVILFLIPANAVTIQVIYKLFHAGTTDTRTLN